MCFLCFHEKAAKSCSRLNSSIQNIKPIYQKDPSCSGGGTSSPPISLKQENSFQPIELIRLWLVNTPLQPLEPHFICRHKNYQNQQILLTVSLKEWWRAYKWSHKNWCASGVYNSQILINSSVRQHGNSDECCIITMTRTVPPTRTNQNVWLF